MRTFFFGGVILAAFALGTVAYAATPSLSISLLTSAGAAPGTPISFAAGASGFDSPSFSVSDSFAGSSITSSDINASGYFSWTPAVSDAGTHYLTVSASDAFGHSATSTVTLTVVSNAVSIQSLSPGPTAAVGRTVTFTISTPGYIDPSFIVSDTYAGSTAVNAVIRSSGGFSWTPAVNQQGTHMLTIYAYDAYGHSGSATQTIFVTHPQISVTSLSPSVAAGSPLHFTILSSGFGASPTFLVSDQFAGTSTLSGSDISSLGSASWTPSASDVGPHFFTVTETDGLGNAASTTASVTVTAAASTVSPAVPISPIVIATTTAPIPSSAASSAPSYTFSKLLEIGSSGAGVTALQNDLTSLGFYSGPVTGYFGALTAAAVRRFQAAHDLSQVGYLGPLTRAALNSGS